jgi:hypothetical protein
LAESLRFSRVEESFIAECQMAKIVFRVGDLVKQAGKVSSIMKVKSVGVTQLTGEVFVRCVYSFREKAVEKQFKQSELVYAGSPIPTFKPWSPPKSG